MAFHDDRFPIDISFGASGGPGFSTKVTSYGGGREQRQVEWEKFRARYDVSHNLRDSDKIYQLRSFLLARWGRAHTFPFQDGWDHKAVMHAGVEELPVIGETTGSNLEDMQLVKHYGSGAFNYTRDIVLPILNTVVLYLKDGGGALTEIDDSNYTVTRPGGVVEWDDYSPSAGLEIVADFEFDVLARFDIDDFDPTEVAFELSDWKGVPIVEVRLEDA
jgi:uncharacterized protein (TIGR02217 family)